MARKRPTPEEIVAKLRQFDVFVSQGKSVADSGVHALAAGGAVNETSGAVAAVGGVPLERIRPNPAHMQLRRRSLRVSYPKIFGAFETKSKGLDFSA